jgi:hypothetical protein
MSAESWVGIATGVCAISGSLFMGLRWVIKSYLAELKPNGGSSLKDQMNRLEQRVDDLYLLLVKK